MCMHNSHQRLDRGEMSHYVAKMDHSRHNVKRDAAAMHHMGGAGFKYLNLFFWDTQIKVGTSKLS